MNGSIRMKSPGRYSILVLGLLAYVLFLLAPARPAQAHSLDVFLQATYITIEPTEIVVEIDLTPGVLVAPETLSALDANGNEQISDAEAQAYATTMLQNVVLLVDGQQMALAITSIEMPSYVNIQAGYGTIGIFTSTALNEGATGTHEISFQNNFAPTGSKYQVNAFVDQNGSITLGTQNRDDLQQSMTTSFSVGGATGVSDASDSSAPVSSNAAGQAQRLLNYFDTPSLSAWQLLLALGLAVFLGGLHALTPGHGKTLVAAYLVGSRGTIRHAVALGAIVTFTHTASVIAIGLIALFASHWIMPDVLVPALEVVSGALVVIMGARLVWQRRTAFRKNPETSPAHGDSSGFIHDHGDGRFHSHLPPAEGVHTGSLLAMGISGGVVPCPEALGIMIIAVGLNRLLLGLGLIVSFSLGLAAVLISIGILLVRSRSLVERAGRFAGAGRLTRALPLVSAIFVTLLGIGIAYRGIANYRPDLFERMLRFAENPWSLLLLAGLAAFGLLIEKGLSRRRERAAAAIA